MTALKMMGSIPMSSIKRFSPANRSRLVRKALVFAACLGVAVWGLWRYEITQEQDVFISVNGKPSLVRLSKLPTVSLLNLRSSQISSLGLSDSRRKVLVVFLSAADCWPCLGELPAWKRLADEMPESLFKEEFIVVRSSKTEALSLLRNDNFSQHAGVYLDDRDLAVSSLRLPQDTPLTILMQGGVRRVIAAEGKDGSELEEARFIKQVESLLPMMPSTADLPRSR
jgi:hypothetical protein